MIYIVSSRRRHTVCALVTVVQTYSLPILADLDQAAIGRGRAPARRAVIHRALVPLVIVIAIGEIQVPIGRQPHRDAHLETLDRRRTGVGYRVGLPNDRSEEHTSELQSLMRISYAVFCLKKKKNNR